MKLTVALVVVAVTGALAAFAGTARAADNGVASAAPSITCGPPSFNAGVLSVTCTTSDNVVYTCHISFSWTTGLSLSCTGTNGSSLTCATRPVPTCTLVRDGVTKTYGWRT
jgi:hypothetical protein